MCAYVSLRLLFKSQFHTVLELILHMSNYGSKNILDIHKVIITTPPLTVKK